MSLPTWPHSPRSAPSPQLLVRPGARFICHADGVCCSDVHALGPISPAETIPLRRLLLDPVIHEPAVAGLGLRVAHGRCVFLREDNLCRVHAELGVAAKPATCRRYPFNLVATPRGLRVVTPHRCPCRSLGPRPVLTKSDVQAEIGIAGVALEVDHQVGRELRWARGQRMSFALWCDKEAAMLAQLAAGQAPEAVLQAGAFANLRGLSWVQVANGLLKPQDDSAFEAAKHWMGEAILFLVQGRAWSMSSRPWSGFFDQAERRTLTAQDAEAMMADWLADEIWSLQWTQFGSFARGRQDLATRLALVRAVRDAIGASGVRGDRATAEALLVIDVITHSQHWYDIVRALEEA